MSNKPNDETFEFDPNFIKINTFFVNKYWSKREYSTLELTSDLQQQLGCLAVALFSFERENRPLIRLSYPTQKENLINKILTYEDISQYVNAACKTGEYSGESFGIDVQVGEKEDLGFKEIDLIVLPRSADSEISVTSTHFFMLIDPAQLIHLPNHKAERDLQRTMIAQFLYGWWVRFTAPKYMSLNPTLGASQANIPTLPIWLYATTLSEILHEGDRSREFVRRPDMPAEIYFEGETLDGLFQWDKWTPRYLFSGSNTKSLKEIQDYGKTLTYWSRWKNSHHDLEKQRAIPISPFSSVETKGNLINDWLRIQRGALGNVEQRLQELHCMAAKAFQTGGIKFICYPEEEGIPKKMPIASHSLLYFSLNHWLTPEKKGELPIIFSSNALSDVEFCRIMHSVAVIAHYLFGKASLTDDVIHRLTQLVARYGHNELSIPTRLDLRAHLLHAARGEPALHALQPFYRDHFFHVLEVCFLGHVLLETKLDENQYLWQLVADHLHLSGNKQEVLRLWYVAALLHDIGYAMDVLNSSRKFLGFFHHSEALRHLDENFKEAIERLSNEEEMERLDIGIKTGEDGIERDHGIIGALHLHSLLKRIAQDDPTINSSGYMPAIQAIALHNFRRPHYKISFAKQPLAFLLIVCDQLQEWRRPRLSFATSPNWLLSTLGGVLPDLTGLEGAFKCMTTNLEVVPDKNGKGIINMQFRINPDNRPHVEFIIEYDERINRNSSLFHVWLDATLNFQRLDLEELPFDITVKYINPYYTNSNLNIKLPQLHRLRDAVHETHMTFLTEWFPTERIELEDSESLLTNGAVSYQCEDGKETLTLNLRNLSRKMLMTSDMSVFWDCIKEWKNFNDDRDFPGDYVSVKPG
ncbi:MAG: hypothetical protein K8L97_30205 [Anaerolineae bacterium]|nr:hypothetical protein [Anaerolineae bacterium]